MAEGGFDDLDMTERNREEYEKEYDAFNDEEALEEYSRLDGELSGASDENKARFEYIENIVINRGLTNETSLDIDGRRPSVSSDFNGTLGLDERFGGDTLQLDDFLTFKPRETDGPNSKKLLSDL